MDAEEGGGGEGSQFNQWWDGTGGPPKNKGLGVADGSHPSSAPSHRSLLTASAALASLILFLESLGSARLLRLFTRPQRNHGIGWSAWHRSDALMCCVTRRGQTEKLWSMDTSPVDSDPAINHDPLSNQACALAGPVRRSPVLSVNSSNSPQIQTLLPSANWNLQPMIYAALVSTNYECLITALFEHQGPRFHSTFY